MPLYHYTCRHSRAKIEDSGWKLQPGPDGLIWLTPLATPNRYALGLTNHSLFCDRTEWRMTVDATAAAIHPWSVVAAEVPHAVRYGLENAPGAIPDLWWVAITPLDVIVAEALTESARKSDGRPGLHA